MTVDPTSRRSGVQGILAPAARLDRWLLVVLVVLLVACAVRYVDRHGLGTTGAAVLAGALVLGLAYATRGLLAGRAWWPTVNTPCRCSGRPSRHTSRPPSSRSCGTCNSFNFRSHAFGRCAGRECHYRRRHA